MSTGVQENIVGLDISEIVEVIQGCLLRVLLYL